MESKAWGTGHVLRQISMHILKAKQTKVILKSGLSYNWVDT